MTRGASHYLGVILIAVVIVPAVVLSLLAMRSIGREEAYLESQLGRTLSAEVDHVSALVVAEIADIGSELAAAAAYPPGGDPGADLEAWRARSPLVDIPFLLSPDFEVLWPRPDRQARASESEFLEKQEAFLKNEVRVPVYENVAVAHKDEILGTAETGAAGTGPASAGPADAAGPPGSGDPYADAVVGVTGEGGDAHIRGGRAGETSFNLGGDVKLQAAADTAVGGRLESRLGEEGKKQVATSLFEQSEPAREKAYRAAEEQGQQIAYRNVEPTAVKGYAKADQDLPDEGAAPPAELRQDGRPAAGTTTPAPTAATPSRRSAPAAAPRSEPTRAGREAEKLRSVFVSQPLKLSEIVSRGESGLFPLTVDGQTRLLFWQRVAAGRILGCLVDVGQVRERIIGVLPGIHSPSRVLTVLDESGLPLIVPQGEEARDWRRPFAAAEISEVLPRWEVAAYLTDPGAIPARARTTSVLTWILIFIMFVSIVAGGTLVVRSASAELKLAQQKTTFAANVSHELKTPLTSIRMFAEMLRDGRVPSEEKRKQYLDMMTAETERLTRLINNVLDFARAGQGKKRYAMKACDLVALGAGIVETQRTRLESAGFTLGLLVRADLLVVEADEEAIKQALVNLLSNAEKYSDQARDIEVSLGRDDGRAVIGVSDRGVGIRAGDAEKIFAEFYRVDDALTSRVKGTGLGLTIARRIARDHGGDIVYEPREGGGSTFRLVLPLAEEKV